VVIRRQRLLTAERSAQVIGNGFMESALMQCDGRNQVLDHDDAGDFNDKRVKDSHRVVGAKHEKLRGVRVHFENLLMK
jgi:hypothetical protein